jgi:predicted AAA+ superfamily ATPase
MTGPGIRLSDLGPGWCESVLDVAPIGHPHLVDLDDFIGIDDAKEMLVRNTEQFVERHPANNVLLFD